MRKYYKTLSFGLVCTLAVRAYNWPNPLFDAIDHHLFDQKGYKSSSTVFIGVPTCDDFFRLTTAGRQNAAEWLRTAFHDVATHDAATGTGGLDASIAVEADRAENIGKAIPTTLDFMRRFLTPQVSLSDLIALGAYAAMEVCGGPHIPFRAGRIDNFTPAPPGVPEPHQDLQSHTGAFRRMGFTQEEMIGLIACGHTIGGVHHTNFPESVPPPPDPTKNSEGVQRFDSTFDSFDNKVATEFIAGTPNNPLAYGANDTTNSDFRIFSSDGNRTISSFAADNEGFKSTCGTLFEKMLNTVPSSVTLSDVIKPIPVKPKISLALTSDGYIQVSGEVRFFNMQENAKRTVSFKWHDRDGQSCSDSTSQCSAVATHEFWQVTTSFSGTTSIWYNFSAKIDAAASISHFWFEMDEHDGSPIKQMKNEEGDPFPIEDRFFFLRDTICQQEISGEDPTTGAAQLAVNATFAVRVTETPAQVQLRTTLLQTGKPTLGYTRSDQDVSAMLSSNSTSLHYQLYKASWNQPMSNFGFWFFDATAMIGEERIVDGAWSNEDFLGRPCQSQ